jgi:predicted amino acid dehydrogenase
VIIVTAFQANKTLSELNSLLETCISWRAEKETLRAGFATIAGIGALAGPEAYPAAGIALIGVGLEEHILSNINRNINLLELELNRIRDNLSQGQYMSDEQVMQHFADLGIAIANGVAGFIGNIGPN